MKLIKKHRLGLCMNRFFTNNYDQDTKRYGFRSVTAAMAIVTILSVTTVFAADVIMVSQQDRKFSPDRIEFNRGSVARIVNDDKVTHHIYVDAPGMSFDSGEQPIGTMVEVRFDKAGTYDVLCAIHPTMRLRIVVK